MGDYNISGNLVRKDLTDLQSADFWERRETRPLLLRFPGQSCCCCSFLGLSPILPPLSYCLMPSLYLLRWKTLCCRQWACPVKKFNITCKKPNLIICKRGELRNGCDCYVRVVSKSSLSVFFSECLTRWGEGGEWLSTQNEHSGLRRGGWDPENRGEWHGKWAMGP